MKINPPLIALLIALAMLALNAAVPQPRLIAPPWNALGFVLVTLGAAMNLWSAHWFRSQKTTIDPRGDATYLAQEGLYRYTRNPMYFGMLIVLLGLSVYLGSLAAFCGPLVFVWIVGLRYIRREEQALSACFGEEYVRYKARVRRWI